MKQLPQVKPYIKPFAEVSVSNARGFWYCCYVVLYLFKQRVFLLMNSDTRQKNNERSYKKINSNPFKADVLDRLKLFLCTHAEPGSI